MTGSRKKSPIASTTDRTTVPIQAPPPISSSPSSICALAEMPRALKPILSDSASATTPRTSGCRRRRWRLIQETSGSETTSISPSAGVVGSRWPSASCSCSGVGLRTATAQVEMPRIITPSSTAWPPTGASRWAISSPSGMRTGSAADCDARGAVACTRPAYEAAWEALRLAARRWKRSTRPPESTSFWRPV